MEVVLIQFREAGKTYYFDPVNMNIEKGDFVVVETIRGIELGKVVSNRIEIEPNEMEIKPIIRAATEEDKKEAAYNRTLEDEVIETTKDLVRQNKLDMKVLASEYTLDRDRLVIYFESEQRVDFRQLVKDLNEVYKTRIELRQVGSRDGAKFIGGLGPCGRVMCCASFLSTFDNVSIKMAKNQNLSLNPQKISGACGKLLCCIKYEHDFYEEVQEDMPNINEYVYTENGRGKVISTQILKRQVRVLFEDGSAQTYNVDEVKRDQKWPFRLS